jgi:cobalt-zinc-cadmium efflux system membrane fusion protein
MNRNVLKTAVILAVGVAAGGFGTYYALRSASFETAKPSDDAHNHSEHEGHDEHERRDEHGDAVKLSPEQMRKFGVEVAEAGPGQLSRKIVVPAQVNLNADHVAHIVPRVTGMVREVRKTIGDVVRTGELLAVLDSRELAESKSACLAAQAKWDLAKANLNRVQTLFDEKIGPEKELLKVRQEFVEIDIEHRTTEAKLHALGLSEEQVAALHREEKDVDFPRYEIRAPFAGTVIEKHITLGELVDTEHNIFTIADLSSVWVDVTLYTDDLPNMRVGKEVVLTADGIDGQTRGTIAYVSPTVSEATRTGLARAVVPNPDLMWRPGLFCTASIVVGESRVEVLVPNFALQTIGNETVLFVEDGDGFRKQPAVVGRTNGSHSEILSGLVPGDRYVVKGAFLLKSELGKSEMGHDH